jgi:hypothetical protein
VAPFGVASDWALGMAEAVADGARFPPLILVTSGLGSDGELVVLEGHARLTALLLCPDLLPPELEVLVGASPAMPPLGLLLTLAVAALLLVGTASAALAGLTTTGVD